MSGSGRPLEFMRRAGHYEGAVKLTDELVNMMRLVQSSVRAETRAYLLFEHALAYRDRGNLGGADFETAKTSAQEARKLWEQAGDPRWKAAAQSLLAFLAFIQGELSTSLSLQEEVFEDRNKLLYQDPKSPDLLAELGRSHDLLGRTADARGSTAEALHHYGISGQVADDGHVVHEDAPGRRHDDGGTALGHTPAAGETLDYWCASS
jgi:tetratricopeptide (TPR) repeat protein